MSHGWATGLFDCCGGIDAGPACCVQHFFCQPCVWGDALRRAGIAGSSALTALLICGGDSAIDEAAGLIARQKLARKYGIEESTLSALFAGFCCPFCARVQEVNTVLARERGLTYGCASLKPRPQKMRRKRPARRRGSSA